MEKDDYELMDGAYKTHERVLEKKKWAREETQWVTKHLEDDDDDADDDDTYN